MIFMNSTKNKVEKEWGSNTLKQNIHIVSLDNPCATQQPICMGLGVSNV